VKINFGRIMLQLAMQHAEREAIINVERKRRYNFAEYHALTNRIANLLRSALGVGKGDSFLLVLENDNLSLMQFPTIYKQLGTAVMANLRESIEELEWQVALFRPKVAFVENRLLPSHAMMLRTHGCRIVAMDPLTDDEKSSFPDVLDFWDLARNASEDESGIEFDREDHIAMLRFTGGTTGRGKCAMYTAGNWLAGVECQFSNTGLGFDSTARMLHAAPLSHGSQIFMYPTLLAGGANITMNALDLEAFRECIEAEAVTHSFLVPTALYRLLELQRTKPRELGSIRTLIYGAAPISPTRLAELVTCFGQVFAQAYAATEVPVLISVLDKSDHRNGTETEIRRLTSAGRISAGIEVIVTDDAGRQLPNGETGEIRIRCGSVIKGYFQNPETTAAEFVDGYWKSGDLGYLDEDGYLFIVDRIKDMIISGGFNIYAVEVEAALASHPAVINAAVVGLPHDDWGEAVHADVIPRKGCDISPEDLIAYVKSRIGAYKAPKSIEFVDELPLSPVGKVLRRAVRARHLDAHKPQIDQRSGDHRHG
jgi:fatty-acyl-CoA synthase